MTEDVFNGQMVLNDCRDVSGSESDGDVDLGLLKDSLAMTPWERMQANDAALNFADSLRAAMEEPPHGDRPQRHLR